MRKAKASLTTPTLLASFAGAIVLWCSVASSWAGSIFLTGHDPDFHSIIGANAAGARTINNAAIDYITDSNFNSFTANGINKFLFVESKISAPSGHLNGVNGITASGFSLGTDFEHHDASTLGAELDELGTKYNAIVVASDFGGVLTQAELNILNARAADIIDFINNDGGLYAMAQGNSGAGLTPNGGHFGFLPFVVSSTVFNQTEVGITVTAFGASLGLTNSDINGNASHNIFTGTFGLDIVDVDRFGNTLTLAGRGTVDMDDGLDNGAIPEPSTVALLALGVFSVLIRSRCKVTHGNN